MLIRLVPQPPSPTVLFTLSFPPLAQSLPPPPSWHLQIQRLATSELELPASIHALDKSAWVVCVLQEVTFDLCAGTVSCLFVDGQREEWPLVGAVGDRCVKSLESVLDDVNSSARENEKERSAGVEESQSHVRSVNPNSVKSPAPVKHKKQRSLLMSLVASLVPHSHHPVPSREAPPPPAPAPVPVEPSPRPLLPSQMPLSGKQLRRRARSTLTDTYRLFVLPELLTRLSPGGYYTWILRSMIDRAQRRMRELAEQRGLRMSDGQIGWTCGRQVGAGNDVEAEGDMFWDEDEEGTGEGDGDSLETETDGSSVHTPTDSVHDSLPSTPSTSVPPSPTSPNKPETQRDSYFPPPSLPPSPASSPSPRINTNPGKRSHARSYISAGPHPPLSRLTHLLTLHLNVQQSIASEQEHMLSVLEIKSRRRAWSNGVRVGILGSQGHMGAAGLGLSMPVRSSPLARCVPVVAGDEWISVWDDDEDDDRVNRPLSPTFGGSGELEIVSRESDLACLFPVTEDDDEEAMEDVPLGEWKPRQRQDSDPDDPQDHPWVEEDSQAPELADMEAGLIPPHRIPSPPPPHVPRRRTKSMRATIPPHPLPLDTPAPFLTSISAPDQLGLLDHDRPVLQRLSPNSLLCQPLAQKHALIGDVAGEFTLAMDLPRKVKVQGGGRYEDEDWLTMRSSDALSRC